jgi:mercuric ion transport protein
MIDRVASLAGVGLVAICCAAPLIALSLPLAGLGAWLAGVSLTVIPSPLQDSVSPPG